MPDQTEFVFHTVESNTLTSERQTKMKIVMLTWEYPPRIIGGISRVVEGLSRSLVELGHEVHVITNEMPGSPSEDIDRGVFVHRVQIETPSPSFHTWVLMMNNYFSKRLGRLAREIGRPDIIHVHDWLVYPAGAEAKAFLDSVLVSTLHSLEFRRSGGIQTPESKMIDSLEWWITFETSIIIVCSNSMKFDAVKQFRVPEDKILVIPIGIEPDKFTHIQVDREQIHGKYAIHPNEKLILFVGRLTNQKGCEYLIKALSYVANYFSVKLVIVGDGYQRAELEVLARTSGVGDRVRFLGFVPDDDLNRLLLAADVMAIPSVYEPFGVVALEGMAAGVPIVASDVDGLGEVIKHEENGIAVFARDPSSIAWGISRILSDPGNTQRLVHNARKDIQSRFSWQSVARLTLMAYQKALDLQHKHG